MEIPAVNTVIFLLCRLICQFGFPLGEEETADDISKLDLLAINP